MKDRSTKSEDHERSRVGGRPAHEKRTQEPAPAPKAGPGTAQNGAPFCPFHATGTALRGAARFVLRQKPNYRVTVTRAAASSFLAGLTSQYDSVYAVALRASPTQLGGINSTGAGVGALMSLPVGWLVDRYGLKRFYVSGIALMATAMVIYAAAPDWRWLIPAIMTISPSARFTGTGCSVLCADQLENRDRATGQNLCSSISSLFSILSPVLAAVLVTKFGGLTARGLRPLYGIRFAGYILILLYVAARLREPLRANLSRERNRNGVVGDFRRIFRDAPHLKRWLVVSSLSTLPLAMTGPFVQVFAHKIKGADQYVLSAMGVAMILTRVVLGVPLGRLADRVGRKKVIYLLTPLAYLSGIVLVLAGGAVGLVFASALWGFYLIMTVITSSMTLELVPLEQMGRWSGVLGVFAGLVTVPAPLIGGLIWQHVGPSYVFIVPIVLDLALRVPLLATIPETLTKGKA